MRRRTATAIAATVDGTLFGDADAEVRRVVTDTRGALRDGDLFVALSGPRFDGGGFVSAAFDAGASAAIVRRGHTVEPPSGRAAIMVEDPLAALQALAADHRDAFEGVVVGITGSNGKTTTKDMLAAALGTTRRIYASPMSYNSQVGVALSLLELDLEADIALVECGISAPGEMERLAAMVRPTHGILVNVGDAHLEGLGDRDTTAREKASLFADLPTGAWCLVPEDERLAVAALTERHVPVVTVAPPAEADVRSASPGFRMDAALAREAARRLGATDEAVSAGLAAWAPAAMRMEISVTPRGVTLINDAYTADPGSMEAALSALVRYSAPGRRVAVLGGMAQLGTAGSAAHAAVGRRVAQLKIDLLVGVGEGGAEIAEAALAAGAEHGKVVEADDVSAAATLLEERVVAGDVVLLKASRPQRLERIAPLLFGAVEPARAHVDIDALVANLRSLESRVGPETAVMPVIKSFGYGLGSERLALELQHAGAEYFCVAYADEGVALRDAGVTTPVLVQNVVPDDADKVVAEGLTAEIGTTEQCALVAAAAAAARRPTRVHVKVDTGMGRSGTRPEDAVALCRQVRDAEWLALEGLMTHFAAADMPEHDAFTREQIRRFDAVISALASEGLRPRWIHACNSAGLTRFPEAAYTMVRTGIGLLGYDEVDGQRGLSTIPVLRLTSRVVATKTLEPGEFVGYGLTWQAVERTEVAIVALGYGDGYPRALSGRGWMSVAGVRCPVRGRVCMDVTMIDISAVPGPVRPGDEVVVFGGSAGEPDLREHAALAGTIPYELLARLTGRVRRIFRRSH